ncbi:ATP-dependent helicase [Marinobacter sp. BGYM27]|uniref:ATP-dependent helicase n=1 Tax=Marinobacter sp. BGYM27 TaxID=2975597 RepID=UPI0021A3EFA3|nr:ATP-dependent helicase [Marinobacter sp. BGYM27]MDG5501483.1 ATP-dependent helicase [Marinobacter sp. BGYM27]
MPTALPPHLTDEQHAIITAGYEHALITAVAGSGKTTTLAWRIRYLLEQGHDPTRILVLMFNRSARNDFQGKLRDVTRDTGLGLPEVRTYHAMGFRLYKRFVREGYLPDFADNILSDQEINFQVWQLTRQLAPESLQDEIKRGKKDYIETASHFIDLVKTTLSPVEIVFEQLGYGEKHRYLIDLFHGFEQWRKRNSRISYADMLYEPVMAIHQNPPLQRLVANKMDLVMVDEYQDTNEIQHLLLRYIAGERARVTVVGDPDQTIYEFRGAQPDFILSRFGEEFESPLEQTLSFTFRYGHQVALLANHLISHNTGRKDVLCHAHPSTPATHVELHETTQDSDVVLRLVEQQRDGGHPLEAVAILFRVWSQSVPIELKLLARQIPYRIDSSKGALFTREVEAITHMMRVCAGHLPKWPPEARLETARSLLRFPHVGLREAELNNLAQLLSRFENDWGQRLLDLEFDAIGPMPTKKLKALGNTLIVLNDFKGSASDLIARYADATELFEGIRSLAMTHETADERIDTVRGFQHYIKSLDVGVPEALNHLDVLRTQAQQTDAGGVQLSTMHRTKGLEWPIVIIPGLQEKYLPHTARQTDDIRSLVESERRLLYVALTRTRQALHLITRPDSNTPHLDGDQSRSRFIHELCFPLSADMGGQLDNRQADSAGSQIRLSTPLTAISQRYAQREGVTLTSSCSATDSPLADAPIWHQSRIIHAVLGAGLILSEEERAFDVRFDSGETLTFSKKSAHLYFRPADTP